MSPLVVLGVVAELQQAWMEGVTSTDCVMARELVNAEISPEVMSGDWVSSPACGLVVLPEKMTFSLDTSV